MGREPVVVNGAPVTSPLELTTGDKIEVRRKGWMLHAMQALVPCCLMQAICVMVSEVLRCWYRLHDPATLIL